MCLAFTWYHFSVRFQTDVTIIYSELLWDRFNISSFGSILSDSGSYFFIINLSSLHCDYNATVDSNTEVLTTYYFKLTTRIWVAENTNPFRYSRPSTSRQELWWVGWRSHEDQWPAGQRKQVVLTRLKDWGNAKSCFKYKAKEPELRIGLPASSLRGLLF